MKGRWSTVLSLMAGILVGVVGLALSALYFIEVVVKRLGEPDQSLLFWYLPILMLGVVMIGAGAALIVRAGFSVRNDRQR
ncbi:MAG: hypothetical protein R3348_03880 [Xanthomonadales bacterium]|nr:hypothetical protein [Xanthomonadales bacterium]